jgi:hypothetical protein
MRSFRFVPALSRKLALLPLWLLIAALLAACGDSGATSGTTTPVPAPATTAPAAPTQTTAAAPTATVAAPAPTNTSAQAATETPATAALTDATVLAALKAAGLPIAEVQIYTAETDPNKLLGRPNQYIAKVSWHDSRLPAPPNPAQLEVSDGGGLEIYTDPAAAQARADYITGIGKSAPALVEYDYVFGPVLLRLSKALTPAQAGDYKNALAVVAGAPVSASAPTAAPAAPTTAAAPSATGISAGASASGGGLKLVEYTQYKDSLNDVVVIGYVRNEGSVPLESIKVVAQALDKGGATVGTGEDLLLALVQLPPGKVAPFQVSLGQLTGTLDKIDVQTQADPFDPNGFNIFTAAQGLTVEGDKLGQPQQYLGTKLTGRVKNGGTTTAQLVRVLAVAYGADGKVVDVGKGGPAIDTIAPGATAPFDLTFSRTDVKIAKYDLLAVGTEK